MQLMHALYIYISKDIPTPPKLPEGMRYDALYTDNAYQRTSLRTLLDALQPYDTLFLVSEAHLAKSLRGALAILHELANKNVTVHVLRNNVAYAGKNSLFSSIPEKAPEAVRSLRAAFVGRRAKGGIDKAHAKGIFGGRKKIPLPRNFKKVAEQVRNKEINYTTGAQLCKMAYTTFVHEVHRLEENPPQYHVSQRKPELTEAEPGTFEAYIDRGMSFSETVLVMYDSGDFTTGLFRLPRNALELLLELFQVFRNYRSTEYMQKAKLAGKQCGRKKLALPEKISSTIMGMMKLEESGS